MVSERIKLENFGVKLYTQIYRLYQRLGKLEG